MEGETMLTFKSGADTAIIVLHEIYGVNRHMIEVCEKYAEAGYDVCCPNLLDTEGSFTYAQQEDAYQYFKKNVGFAIHIKVNEFIRQLRKEYEKIILLGFSVGATIAWRCTVDGLCDAMAGCYGSRIRDYLDVVPQCPALLIFADKDQSFQPDIYVNFLRNKANTTVHVLEGDHGFCDRHSQHYHPHSAERADKLIEKFLAEQSAEGPFKKK